MGIAILSGIHKNSVFGVAQTPEGTGTGNNLYPELSVVGTGKGIGNT